MDLKVIRLLKDSEFCKLIAAQLLSDSAAWLDYTAIGVLLVYFWHEGSSAMASFTIIIALAYCIGSPIAGVIVDRFSPKLIMLISNTLRTLLLLGYTVASSKLAIFILLFSKTLVTAFYDPATQVRIRYTIANNYLIQANALSSMVSQFIRIFGPLIGGALLAVMSPKIIFLICSILFLISSLVLFFLKEEKYDLLNKDEKQPLYFKNFLKELTDSMNYIANSYLLKTGIIAYSMIILVIFLCESFYIMLFNYINLSVSASGVIYCLGGIGGIIGSFFISQLKENIQPLIIISIGACLAGLCITSIGCIALFKIKFEWIYFIVIFIFLGIANSALIIPFATLIQVGSPKLMIGRISSIMNGVQTIFQMIGPVLGFLLVKFIYIANTFVLSGYLCLAIGIIAFCFTKSSKINIDYIDLLNLNKPV